MNGVKVVPSCISEYLTPLALAVLIMDSGVKASGAARGLIIKLSTTVYGDIKYPPCPNCSLKARGVMGEVALDYPGYTNVKACTLPPKEAKQGNNFSYSDCLLLVQALDKNFGLKARIESTGVSSQYRIYIPKESMGELRDIVRPFITPEMKYKLLP